MTTAEQDDAIDAPAAFENIIIPDVSIDVSDDAGTVLLDTLADLVVEAETWQQPAIALWSSRSQGYSNTLRQLRGRLDGWFDYGRSRYALRLLPNGAQRPRRSGREAVRTRLTRAWAWRRAGLPGQRLGEYDLAPAADATGVACTVSVDIRACKTLDDIRSGLARAILSTISERLPRHQSERMWFDLNLRRTDPAKFRRRILASYLPQSLGGALAAALVICAALVILGRRILAPGSTLSMTDLVAIAGVVATVIGLIVQAKSGGRNGPVGLVTGRGLAGPSPAGLLDDASPGVDPYLIAWEQDLIDVLFLAEEHTKIVIMIDDLDRCGPEIVAGVLESVRALPRVMIVAAFDPALVAGQLEERTPWLAGRTQTDPVAYGRFDRLGWIDLIEEFDVSIPLPPPSRVLLARQVQTMNKHPDRTEAGATSDPATAVAGFDLTAVQASPAISQALEEAIGAAAGRSHHRVRALVNLWRFYATIEYRCGRLGLPGQDRPRAIVFFAQLVLYWPWLLDLLAPSTGKAALLKELADACEDDSRWHAGTEGLHVDDDSLTALRGLLYRCGSERGLLIELAQRHL